MKLKNKNELNKYIAAQAAKIENALIYALEYLVAVLQNHAKENQGHSLIPTDKYQRTGNLTASIGGAVVKNGRIIVRKGFEGAPEGVKGGLEFLNSLTSGIGSGYGVIMVAGMDYASFVENYYGLNVLKKTELITEEEMQKMFRLVKSRLN